MTQIYFILKRKHYTGREIINELQETILDLKCGSSMKNNLVLNCIIYYPSQDCGASAESFINMELGIEYMIAIWKCTQIRQTCMVEMDHT